MATTRGQGTLLKVSIAASYTTISQRTSVTPPKKNRAKIETTDLDSTAETSIPGIMRVGECDMVLNYDPAAATHAYLEASIDAGSQTAESFKLIYSDSGAAEEAFTAWVMELGREEATTDGLMKCAVKLCVTGLNTLTP